MKNDYNTPFTLSFLNPSLHAARAIYDTYLTFKGVQVSCSHDKDDLMQVRIKSFTHYLDPTRATQAIEKIIKDANEKAWAEEKARLGKVEEEARTALWDYCASCDVEAYYFIENIQAFVRAQPNADDAIALITAYAQARTAHIMHEMEEDL